MDAIYNLQSIPLAIDSSIFGLLDGHKNFYTKAIEVSVLLTPQN